MWEAWWILANSIWHLLYILVLLYLFIQIVVLLYLYLPMTDIFFFFFMPPHATWQSILQILILSYLLICLLPFFFFYISCIHPCTNQQLYNKIQVSCKQKSSYMSSSSLLFLCKLYSPMYKCIYNKIQVSCKQKILLHVFFLSSFSI